MLAYAPQRRTTAASGSSRRTLFFVVGGHVALVAVALTTRMTIDRIAPQGETEVRWLPSDPPPPDPVEPARADTRPTPRSVIDRPQPDVSLKPIDLAGPLDTGPDIPTGPIGGLEVGPVGAGDPPKADPVRIAARFNTPDSLLRPPYPNDKIRTEEEATLRLRLTIDDRGRVTAVEPVGRVDPSFFESARKHILRSWRYKPATVDGVATGSSTVISLSFKLEEA